MIELHEKAQPYIRMSERPKTILIVEDEALIALDEERKLKHAGYSVACVASGEESIDIFRKNPDSFDLVLMDIDLGGGIDGTEAAQEILRSYDVPILFLSSHTEPELVEKTEKITNYGYVVKSSPFTVLDASIKMAFKLFEAQKKLYQKNMEIEAINERLRISLEKVEESEERARRDQLFLRTLLDNLPDVVYFNDAEGRKIIANRADLENIGLCGEEAIGKTDLELFPGDIGVRGHRDNLAVVRNGEPIINREEEFIRPDGGRRWLLTSKIPLRDRQGSIIGLVGIGRDITDRKKAEEKDAQERIFLRTLIDVLPDPVYFKDATCRKIISNISAFHNVERNDTNDELGKTDLDLFPGPVGMRGYLDDQRVIRDGTPILNREEDFVQPDGSVLWLSTSKVPLRNVKGEIIGLAGIGHDITELKNLEKSLQKTAEQKTMLMKELQHRVKNSLSIVSSLLNLEIDSLTDEAARVIFRETLGRIDAISAVYERLYLSESLDSVDIRAYIGYLAEAISKTIASRTVRISSRSSDLQLDANHALPLGLILNELLTNAIKYAYPPGAEGEIRIVLEAADGKIRLSVADDGIGLPEGFDPMTAESMGMSLVTMLAKQLGGAIQAESKRGAQISVTFPQ
jgi:PAS domain S-box-containing protein